MEIIPSQHPDPSKKIEEMARGVFSSQTHSYVGFGTTKRRVKQNVFVYAERLPDGTFRLRNLNKHFVPAGRATIVTKDQLLSEYLPEPDIFMNKVLPMLRKVRETVEAADQHRAKSELMSAEFEYKNALRVDEEHIRATFGLGLTYLDRGEVDNANLVCRRLITLEAAFGKEHKHLFNEFGIKMRKHKMYAQALRYYFKAYRLAGQGQDDHLLYNISRTYYEKGKLHLARKFLNKALELNADFEEAQNLLHVVEKKEAKGQGESSAELDLTGSADV